jgi:hypothetical protein
VTTIVHDSDSSGAQLLLCSDDYNDVGQAEYSAALDPNLSSTHLLWHVVFTNVQSVGPYGMDHGQRCHQQFTPRRAPARLLLAECGRLQQCGHGFVRAADGTVVTFDAPGAGTGGTNAFDISPSGEAMGWYLDSNFTFHGFVRKP